LAALFDGIERLAGVRCPDEAEGKRGGHGVFEHEWFS
jgi:hypothetical protein